MFRAKTALVTVLVLLSCVSMQAQKADVFGTLVTGKANNPVSNANVLRTTSKSMCLGVDIL